MSELKGACIIGQSGGPSAVINCSAYGVIKTALENPCITKVYGAYHGIKGVLNDELMIMDEEDAAELENMLHTPSSALGSCRYKIADPDVDDTDYKRILEIFKKYDVRYFFYNGGNDSMDTCNKISKYMNRIGYDCRVIGVPKTIDNDLAGTDHCPGFASAAKYIATSIMEISRDSQVYDTGMVTIIECMGRHAGWLTAAAALANTKNDGPDLIYLPEVDFDTDNFIADIKRVYAEKKNCIVAVSEAYIMRTAPLSPRQRPPVPTVSAMPSWAVWPPDLPTSSKPLPAPKSARSSCPCCSVALRTALPAPISPSLSCPAKRLSRPRLPVTPTRWSALSVPATQTAIAARPSSLT